MIPAVVTENGEGGKMKPWVLLSGVAAVAAALGAGASDAPVPAAFMLRDDPAGHLDVVHNGRILARYMHAADCSTPERRMENYKPYLHVFDPEGRAPITKGAGGAFTHHRGIFLGWRALKVAGRSFDRWRMSGGEQVHRKFSRMEADEKHAAFTSLVTWTGDMGRPIVEEERTFEFRPAPVPAYALIDLASRLKAVGGETEFGGDPEHSGLQYRPAEAIDRTKTVYVFPRENANPRKDRDYPWVGESYTLEGRRYSVVWINHPANPTGTVISAYRDYGRFGGFFKAAVPRGGTLVLRCRFLVMQGEMPSTELVQRVANDFTGRDDPVPKLTIRPAEGAASRPASAARP